MHITINLHLGRLDTYDNNGLGEQYHRTIKAIHNTNTMIKKAMMNDALDHKED